MAEIKSQIQINFINQVKNALPIHQSLPDVLSELLTISMDSAYRRIRCETLFSIEEVAILCNYFKIPFNPVSSQDLNTVTFSYTSLQGKEDGLTAFLLGLKENLQRIAQFKEKEIVFAAEDVPVFQHFRFPNLARFKCFYWGKSILNQTTSENNSYQPEVITDVQLALCADIIDLYALIPSTEIWDSDTVHSSLKQIEFYWDSGFFKSQKQALTICSEFREMIEVVRLQAEKETKLNMAGQEVVTNSYKMLQSDVTIGNNCILVKMEDNKVVYLSLHTFNNMLTTNYQFCCETEAWIDNLCKKSNQISGIAERQRNQFFKSILKKVDTIISKIENE